MKKTKIGLFPGSFNPIHLGHLIVADSALREFPLEEIWFVISPQNPLKKQYHMLSQELRSKLLLMSIMDNPKFKMQLIEFTMPKPSYTADTLRELSKEYPEHEFYLLMGTDILPDFPKWKDYNYILDNYKMLLYERNNIKIPEFLLPKFIYGRNYENIFAPQIGISSTQIREYIKSGVNYRYYLPENVYEYIKTNTLYKVGEIDNS
jgi:nicotinate-nucleotide adenylyltransferase